MTGFEVDRDYSDKKVLLLGMTPEAGGAEKVIFEIYSAFKDQYEIDLGFIRGKAATSLFADCQYQAGFKVLKKIFFGDYDLIHSHLFWPSLLVAMRKLWDFK